MSLCCNGMCVGWFWFWGEKGWRSPWETHVLTFSMIKFFNFKTLPNPSFTLTNLLHHKKTAEANVTRPRMRAFQGEAAGELWSRSNHRKRLSERHENTSNWSARSEQFFSLHFIASLQWTYKYLLTRRSIKIIQCCAFINKILAQVLQWNFPPKKKTSTSERARARAFQRGKKFLETFFVLVLLFFFVNRLPNEQCPPAVNWFMGVLYQSQFTSTWGLSCRWRRLTTLLVARMFAQLICLFGMFFLVWFELQEDTQTIE